MSSLESAMEITFLRVSLIFYNRNIGLKNSPPKAADVQCFDDLQFAKTEYRPGRGSSRQIVWSINLLCDFLVP